VEITTITRRRGGRPTWAGLVAAVALFAGADVASAQRQPSVVYDPFLAAEGLVASADFQLQQPLGVQGEGGAAASSNSSLITDPNVQPASAVTAYPGYPAGAYAGSEYAIDPQPILADQPASWISGPNLKSGVAFVLGDDLFTDQDIGYTIAGGYRQALGPAFGQRTFFELGGSYLSAYGESTRSIPGTITTRLAGQVIDTEVVDDLFNSTLKEAKRGTVHTALGWYWGDLMDERSYDPQWRIATRFGGRLGHMRGRFDEVAVGTPDSDETFTYNYYHKADTTGGIFAGAEMILLARDLRIGSTALTLDTEYGVDWVDFGAWGEGTLATATLTLGAMWSR
jgi:hypothetical protein